MIELHAVLLEVLVDAVILPVGEDKDHFGLVLLDGPVGLEGLSQSPLIFHSIVDVEAFVEVWIHEHKEVSLDIEEDQVVVVLPVISIVLEPVEQQIEVVGVVVISSNKHDWKASGDILQGIEELVSVLSEPVEELVRDVSQDENNIDIILLHLLLHHLDEIVLRSEVMVSVGQEFEVLFGRLEYPASDEDVSGKVRLVLDEYVVFEKLVLHLKVDSAVVSVVLVDLASLSAVLELVDDFSHVKLFDGSLVLSNESLFVEQINTQILAFAFGHKGNHEIRLRVRPVEGKVIA